MSRHLEASFIDVAPSKGGSASIDPSRECRAQGFAYSSGFRFVFGASRAGTMGVGITSECGVGVLGVRGLPGVLSVLEGVCVLGLLRVRKVLGVLGVVGVLGLVGGVSSCRAASDRPLDESRLR